MQSVGNDPPVDSTTGGLRSTAPPGVLWFILADMIVFCMLFAGFMIERMQKLAVFDQSAATLDVRHGVFNTLVLVTSGLFVVLAVNSARSGQRAATRRWLLSSFLVGLGFAVSKVIEYAAKFEHGIDMQTNDFYMYYFALTGAHFLHFIGGMVMLAILWFLVGSKPLDGRLVHSIESGALYWHMVDLLWIFLFPMLYLLGAK